MKKLLLTAVLALTSTNTLAMSAYEYCSKFSKLGGDAVEIRSQGHTKEKVLSELSKTGALTTENRQLIELAYSIPMTSDLQGDIANVKRVVFSICMDSME
tara:strand:+ start:648 stop:947 length:300 start_codon:yes stop_codon:yes gene_type:complete